MNLFSPIELVNPNCVVAAPKDPLNIHYDPAYIITASGS